uniref:NADH dehydrogenase subunit 4 n=1 Tax=Caliscelis rhabdocladis TaxID=3081100 RepID=UPI002E76AC24|nr:NADH dehydrogenase subunit 4 [Caliscelis rhabdocladis]WQB38577.1 NADH dehydrogenase subunit 4 [Caliscelis rhabdocladis]
MLKFILYIFFLTPICFLNKWFVLIYCFFFFFFFFWKKIYLVIISLFLMGLVKKKFLLCFVVYLFGFVFKYFFLYLSFDMKVVLFFFITFYFFIFYIVYIIFSNSFFFILFFFWGELDSYNFYYFWVGVSTWTFEGWFFFNSLYFIFFFSFFIGYFFCKSFFWFIFFFFNLKLHSDLLMFFIVMSFMVKFPLFGLHIWLPSAHVEAPVSGSMVLAGVLLKLGGYGFFRMLDIVYFFIYYYGFFFISLSMVGSFYVGMFCMIQSDLKMLIAYSSVCHMGMVISGLFSMTNLGILGSLLFMMGHGFVSSGLFYLVGLVYDRLGSRSFYVLKGLIYFMPSLSFFWFMFCIMNMSCPPSINLFSEIFLVFGLLSWSEFVSFFFFFFFFF